VNDAIVIGGGPAGSLTALLLARRNWRVTILEQHAFPRDKVCGECLSSRGIDVLRRAGLLEPLLAANPIELRFVNLHAARTKSVSLPLPRPMMGISRQWLDGFLLEQAAHAGAIVRQRVRCEAIESASRPHVRVRDLSTNRVETLDADRVIVADGKRSLIGDPPPQTGDFGVKAHFRGVAGPRDAIDMFGCAGCYGGIAPIEQERWNLSFSVRAARLRSVGSKLDQLLEELLDENPTLRARLSTASRCTPWLTSPVHRFGPRRPPIAHVICVGNGSAAMEPICGEGIGNALQSAETTAKALIASGDGETAALEPAHHSGAALAVRRSACRAAALLASSPTAARLALPILDRLGLGNHVLRLMGKS
jgi:flavin-dependent dehydrogenase